MDTALQHLLQNGGPLGFGLTIGVAMWWYERRETKALQSKVLKLAMTQVEANTKHTYALEALSRLVDKVSDRL